MRCLVRGAPFVMLLQTRRTARRVVSLGSNGAVCCGNSEAIVCLLVPLQSGSSHCGARFVSDVAGETTHTHMREPACDALSVTRGKISGGGWVYDGRGSNCNQHYRLTREAVE